MKEWLTNEGSTRPAGLARILLVLMVWSEHAGELRLFNAFDWILVPYTGVLLILTLLMGIGWKARASTAATGIWLTGAWGLLGTTEYYEHFDSHHTYLLGFTVLLLSLLPVERSYSLDRLLEVRRAEAAGVLPRPERADLWAIRVFQIQISALYFYGAYSKTFWTYGERMESIFAFLYFSLDHPGEWFAWLMLVLGYTTIVLEYVFSVGFFFKRTIPLMVALGVVLHGAIYWTLPVGTFTVLMYVYYLLLVDPDWIHGLLEDATR